MAPCGTRASTAATGPNCTTKSPRFPSPVMIPGAESGIVRGSSTAAEIGLTQPVANRRAVFSCLRPAAWRPEYDGAPWAPQIQGRRRKSIDLSPRSSAARRAAGEPTSTRPAGRPRRARTVRRSALPLPPARRRAEVDHPPAVPGSVRVRRLSLGAGRPGAPAGRVARPCGASACPDGGYEDRESVVDAGFDLDGFAFVMTRGGTAPLSDEENVLPYMGANPVYALRHMMLLADAMAVLHGVGLIHRNVWPGTIRRGVRVPGGPQPTASPVPIRDEHARLQPAAQRDARLRLRCALAAVPCRPGSAGLCYTPPERLRFLFPKAPTTCWKARPRMSTGSARWPGNGFGAHGRKSSRARPHGQPPGAELGDFPQQQTAEAAAGEQDRVAQRPGGIAPTCSRRIRRNDRRPGRSSRRFPA